MGDRQFVTLTPAEFETLQKYTDCEYCSYVSCNFIQVCEPAPVWQRDMIWRARIELLDICIIMLGLIDTRQFPLRRSGGVITNQSAALGTGRH